MRIHHRFSRQMSISRACGGRRRKARINLPKNMTDAGKKHVYGEYNTHGSDTLFFKTV
jgi:hypothetical protein